MIFKTKKQFEEEVYKRISEIDFRTKADERIYRLEDSVRELRYRLESLEQTIRQPVPVNPTTPMTPIPTWQHQTTCTTAEVKTDG